MIFADADCVCMVAGLAGLVAAILLHTGTLNLLERTSWMGFTNK
jgi:hypothetical protein